jgi:hypothetical protein
MIFLKFHESRNSFTPGDRAFSICRLYRWVALGKEIELIALFSKGFRADKFI